MVDRPNRPERPSRPERAERPARDVLAEKLKRRDEAHRRRHPTANPLKDVPLTGNAENDSKAHHEAYENTFSQRMKNEAERMKLATDSEFYLVVAFQSRAQKEAFLAATQWDGYGDKYLDGYYVAAKMGIDLPDAKVPYNTSGKVDKKLAALVRDDLPD